MSRPYIPWQFFQGGADYVHYPIGYVDPREVDPVWGQLQLSAPPLLSQRGRGQAQGLSSGEISQLIGLLGKTGLFGGGGAGAAGTGYLTTSGGNVFPTTGGYSRGGFVRRRPLFPIHAEEGLYKVDGGGEYTPGDIWGSDWSGGLPGGGPPSTIAYGGSGPDDGIGNAPPPPSTEGFGGGPNLNIRWPGDAGPGGGGGPDFGGGPGGGPGGGGPDFGGPGTGSPFGGGGIGPSEPREFLGNRFRRFGSGGPFGGLGGGTPGAGWRAMGALGGGTPGMFSGGTPLRMGALGLAARRALRFGG